jgi:hypothetical protein
MLINQHIIINVILIFAILWLANYLSEDTLLNTVKSMLKLNLTNKKYNVKNLNDIEASSLETFLKSLIVKHKGGKINYKKLFKPNEKDKSNIVKFFEKKLKNENHKINNVTINNIVFYKKDGGFEFKPLLLEGNYYYNEKLKGIIKLQIEISFKFDNADSIFISPQRITNHSGNYFIHRIAFLELKKKNDKLLKKITSDSEIIKNKKKKIIKSKIKKTDTSESDNSEETNNSANESTNNSTNESANNSADKSVDKSVDNYSVNSLIPDEIEFSTEFNTSLNQSA